MHEQRAAYGRPFSFNEAFIIPRYDRIMKQWQDSIIPNNLLRTAAVDFIGTCLRESGFQEKIASTPTAPFKPAKVIPSKDAAYPGFTAYSGASRSQFNALQSLLTEWLGTPTKCDASDNSAEPDAIHIEYAHGVSLNFSLYRDNGISLYYPKQTAAILAGFHTEAKKFDSAVAR